MRTSILNRIPAPIANALVLSALAALMLGAGVLLLDSAADLIRPTPPEERLAKIHGAVRSISACTGTTPRQPGYRTVTIDGSAGGTFKVTCRDRLAQVALGAELQVKVRSAPSFFFSQEEVWDARASDLVFVAYDTERRRHESLSWWRFVRTGIFLAVTAGIGWLCSVAWRDYKARRG